LLPQIDNSIVIATLARQLWSIEFHPEFEPWAQALPDADQEALLAALEVLGERGPSLGRPLVDHIEGSAHQNMKELRPGSTGRTEIRVLFAFDVERRAILLVGGDKSDDWKGWYRRSIPIADQRFSAHQAKLRERQKATAKKVHKRKKGKGR
jgi:hypothetical protein